jgi:hypothetical protein
MKKTTIIRTNQITTSINAGLAIVCAYSGLWGHALFASLMGVLCFTIWQIAEGIDE